MHLLIEIATALGALATGSVALWARLKLIPFLQSHSSAVRENVRLTYERNAALARAELEKQSAKAWQDRFESINGQIEEMRAEFNEKIERLERKQDLALGYITELIVWGHDRRRTDPMPQPPEELRADVSQAMQEHNAVATQRQERS